MDANDQLQAEVLHSFFMHFDVQIRGKVDKIIYGCIILIEGRLRRKEVCTAVGKDRMTLGARGKSLPFL